MGKSKRRAGSTSFRNTHKGNRRSGATQRDIDVIEKMNEELKKIRGDNNE